MSGEAIDDNPLLIRYLLGLLADTETERLDQLSVTQDDFAWRLQAVENDMVDAYVKGGLAGETLDRFRSLYLASPKRVQKVEFARALLALTRQEAPPRTRSLPLEIKRWALASCAAAAAMVAGFLIYNQRQLQREVSQLQISRAELQQRERQIQGEIQRELDQLSSLRPQPAAETPANAFTSLTLVLPPPTRGVERVPSATLSPGASRITFDMQLEADDFPLYRVALQAAASRRIVWRSGDVKSRARDGRPTVNFVAPAELLKSGRYVLELSGGQNEPIGNYPFNVLEK